MPTPNQPVEEINADTTQLPSANGAPQKNGNIADLHGKATSIPAVDPAGVATQPAPAQSTTNAGPGHWTSVVNQGLSKVNYDVPEKRRSIDFLMP